MLNARLVEMIILLEIPHKWFIYCQSLLRKEMKPATCETSVHAYVGF